VTAPETLLAVLPNVRAHARRWARGDREFEEELAQSIAEKFLASWPRFRWDGTLRHAGGWVAGIARSLAFNERRKFATYRRHLARLAAGETSGYVNPPKGGPKRPRNPTPSLFAN
jgi:DNA-directed RNA polymerase specialized sigma24 family protein